MITKKILKIIKNSDTCSIDDLAIITELDEKSIKVHLDKLISDGTIKAVSDTSYTYIDSILIKQHLEKKHYFYDKIYYYFRDYYLLYSTPTMEDAIKLAKKKFVDENPELKDKKLGTTGAFTVKLHREFSAEAIDHYRSGALELKNEFKLNNPNLYKNTEKPHYIKTTINSIPDYLNIGINDSLKNLHNILIFRKTELLNCQKIIINNNLSVSLNKYYRGCLNICDTTFDILIALLFLYKSKSKNNKSSVLINIDDILFLRNYKQNIDVRNQNGFFYHKRDKINCIEQAELLSNILVCKNTCLRGAPLLTIKKSEIVSDSDFYYELKVNKEVLKGLSGSLNSKVLIFNHDIIHSKEKRIAYHLAYLSIKNAPYEFTFKELLKIIGKEQNYVIAKKNRDYLERSLNLLVDLKIISSWLIKKGDSIINKEAWLRNVEDLSIIFEISQES